MIGNRSTYEKAAVIQKRRSSWVLTSTVFALMGCLGPDDPEYVLSDDEEDAELANSHPDSTVAANGVCVAELCLNGGICTNGNAPGTFTCDCTGTGFQGALCESNVNDCSAASCLNGGRCIDGLNGTTCDCTGTGFAGVNCGQAIDDCTADVCLNGGTCIDGVSATICDCGVGFTGRRCEVNANDCAADSCSNGGTCIDGVASFVCSCALGFAGERCEMPVGR
jgi:hypothetical protein